MGAASPSGAAASGPAPTGGGAPSAASSVGTLVGSVLTLPATVLGGVGGVGSTTTTTSGPTSAGVGAPTAPAPLTSPGKVTVAPAHPH